MASRLQLHNALIATLGAESVHFQPPESRRLKYPCIIYHLVPGAVRRADDKAYNYYRCYEVTIIDYDPEVEWDKKMLEDYQYVSFIRFYTADNLNHWVFKLYY